jgi:hypothetical protein
LRDDAAKSWLFADAFNVLWYGLLVIVLLLAFKHDIASSVGVLALSFLLDVLLLASDPVARWPPPPCTAPTRSR